MLHLNFYTMLEKLRVKGLGGVGKRVKGLKTLSINKTNNKKEGGIKRREEPVEDGRCLVENEQSQGKRSRCRAGEGAGEGTASGPWGFEWLASSCHHLPLKS